MKLKKSTLVVLALLCTITISAQDLGGAIEDAADEVSGIFVNLKRFLWALAALVALYGVFNVYSKYQSQDQDAPKAAARFGFGFIFLIASGFIVEAVFIN